MLSLIAVSAPFPPCAAAALSGLSAASMELAEAERLFSELKMAAGDDADRDLYPKLMPCANGNSVDQFTVFV